MKLKNIAFVVAIMALVFTGCKKEGKKRGGPKADKIEAVDGSSERLALNISGMTCEIGCAKLIESKLSKQDGVIDAKVVFADSIAKIKFDPAKTNKAALMSFVGGIADNMYSVTEAAPKSCDAKKVSCDKEKKSCDKGKKACDKAKKSCDKKEAACTGAAKETKACEAACAKSCASKEKSCAAGCCV